MLSDLERDNSMKTSIDGRNYILVIVDLCTRLIWLYAISDNASGSITACLRDLCAVFGKPLRIQTDNGTEIKNLNMTTLLSEIIVLFPEIPPRERRCRACGADRKGAPIRGLPR